MAQSTKAVGVYNQVTGVEIIAGTETALRSWAVADVKSMVNTHGVTALGMTWRFDTSTSAGDPGSGKVRFNNATMASVTSIYVDIENKDGNDVSAILGAIASGSKIYIQQSDDSANFILATLSSAPTDSTGYYTITFTVDNSGGVVPGNNDDTSILFFSPSPPTELTDLSDVNTSTPTNRNVLVADGTDWESRALVEADVSDLGSYATQLSELSDVNTSTATNRNVLVADGVDWESRALVEADISDLGSYATQLSDLTDVNTSTATNRNVLVADGVDWESRALVEADISDLGTYVATGDNVTWTGTHDFGGSASLELPNSATPTVDADGEIAVDTTVTDFSHGILKYYGGEELAVIAVPIAELTTPSDKNVIAYNATNDEFELVDNDAGGSMAISITGTTANVATGTGLEVFRATSAKTLGEVRASVTTAPTGSTLIVDINVNGSSILSTKLSIDATEKTSTTAASQAVISSASIADDDEITIDVDQVGSTVTGAGLKVYLIWE